MGKTQYNIHTRQKGLSMEHFNTEMDRKIYEETGYKTFTTFALDFEIADGFGEKAIRDTYKRSQYWISDYKYWTELVFILNWNIWKHAQDPLGLVYDELWRDAEQKFYEYYADNTSDSDDVKQNKAEARRYYYQTLD